MENIMNDYYKIEEFKSSKLFVKYGITSDMEERISYLIKNVSKSEIQKSPDSIRGFIKYNVEGNWAERFQKIQKEYKRDGFSLESCLTRYGKQGTEISNARRKSVGVTKEKYLQTHSEKEWKTLCEGKNTTSLSSFIKRYGPEKGLKKRKEYTKKRLETFKRNGPYPPTINRQKFIDKYGEKEGLTRYTNWIYKRRRTLSLEGFIERFGENGRKKYKQFCKDHDTRSKSACIKKYGLVEGTRKYKELQKRASYANSEMYYIEKYGKKNGPIKWKELNHRRTKNSNSRRAGGTSRKSQKCLWKIYSKLPENLKNDCWFSELNEEYIFYVFSHPKINSIIVDFKCGNKLIEFNGTYWHKNKFKIDNDKKIYLESLGYEIYVIEEINWDENQEQVVESAIKFILNNNN